MPTLRRRYSVVDVREVHFAGNNYRTQRVRKPELHVYDLGGLDIGDDVMIGPNVSIITSGHPIKASERRLFVVAKPIVIESNVWVAAGAMIIGGVTVGENSVVAAASVVTKNVPRNTLVAGNPARAIRTLTD